MNYVFEAYRPLRGLSSAACVSCLLCNTIVAGMGGPRKVVCQRCYERAENGELAEIIEEHDYRLRRSVESLPGILGGIYGTSENVSYDLTKT